MSWTEKDLQNFVSTPATRSILSERFREMLENPHTSPIPMTANDIRVAGELGIQLVATNYVDVVGGCYDVYFPDEFTRYHEMTKNIESNRDIIRATTVNYLLSRRPFVRNLTPFERRTLRRAGYHIDGYNVSPPSLV